MKQMLLRAAAAGGLAILSYEATANPAEIQVVQSDQYGPYLADSEGRALYLFTADRQGSGNQEPTVSCSGECLAAWPPLYTTGAPQAGEKVDDSKLGTVEHDGQSMVTYNGWPLYYFAKDTQPGQATGQDIESFGGEWYLVTPDGEKVENH